MDIKIETESSKFKMRVNGCLVKDDKLLCVQICNNGFYCLPGGHVHLGEDSKVAMQREFEEEARIKCTDLKLLALVENFFVNKKNKDFHEISFYYLIKADNIETKDFSYVENDEGVLKNLEFRWFNIDELKDIDFRPTIIGDKLQSHNLEFEHIIFDQTK